jgi:hypothetical protein
MEVFMLYLVYATLTAWLIMMVVNNRSHKKYIIDNKDKFLKILDDNYRKKTKIKVDDKLLFSFTPDNIEKREFTKYLNMGRVKYIFMDTAKIMFSFIFLFALVYSLEYLPYFETENNFIDLRTVWQLLVAGYLICVADVFSKTIKYDQIIKSWKEKHPDTTD